MSDMILISGAVVVVVWVVTLYNSLVVVKHSVDKAWANIEVLLKQRHDEIPKLVEMCKQYRTFEVATLQAIVESRSRVYTAMQSGNISALNQAEGGLKAQMGKLFAVGESYPDLKTNQSYLQMQNRISGLESDIADRRELYNEAVNINNIKIQQFPDMILAKTLGFSPRTLYEVPIANQADPDIRKLFADNI